MLHEMCGAGVVNDLVLTGRVMDADEALRHGVISRIVAPDELDTVVRQAAEQIAKTPTVAVKLYRDVVRHLSLPAIRSPSRLPWSGAPTASRSTASCPG